MQAVLFSLLLQRELLCHSVQCPEMHLVARCLSLLLQRTLLRHSLQCPEMQLQCPEMQLKLTVLLSLPRSRELQSARCSFSQQQRTLIA